MAAKRKKPAYRRAQQKPRTVQHGRAKMARKHEHDPEDDEGPRPVAESGAKAAAGPPTAAASPEEIDRAVEFMSRQFSSAIPEAALRENPYELPEDDALRRMKNDKVPDGRYRVVGHEYVLEFADGHLTTVEHVTPTTDSDSYTPIPHPPTA